MCKKYLPQKGVKMPINLGKILLILLVYTSILCGYSFQMAVNNTNPMLGEKIVLTLDFIYDTLEDYDIEEPHFEAFEIKPLEDKTYQDQNGTWHVRLRYELRATKTGIITLTPLKTHIEMIAANYQDRYNRNKYLQKFDISTHALTLKVKPLPHSLKVIGSYALYASVDKQKVTMGEPVTLNVRLEGEGNMENLDFLTFHIPHVTIYEKSLSSYEKEFILLSDQNFTIPSLVFGYITQKDKEIRQLDTNIFHIVVHTAKDTTNKKPYAIDIYILYVFFFLLLFWYSVTLFKSLEYLDEKAYFLKQLKQTKNKEELLKKVVHFMHKNRQLKRLIYQLEDVDASKFKALKKEILTHF
ncbi:MAG: hypothetical protein DSZ12_05430 [Sulfurovum sp.]|nr:MAG: hypothetical protein DSZ12_05430 [Sulfurovum sp.]